MIRYREKPFYLNDDQIAWVEKKVNAMSTEEKVGQLFCEVIWGEDDANCDRIFDSFAPGAVMFRDLAADAVVRLANRAQERSPIPLLVAANLERGGNGIVREGTYFASPMGVAATDDEIHAYRLGKTACAEGAAVGANWTFEPVVDLNRNYLSSITNTRTFGSDPDRVIRMASAYMQGAREEGCVSCIKHFPGDGMDYRDQHLLCSVNPLDVEKWENSYGRVYRSLIEAGAPTLMAAHIKLPKYSKYLNPALSDEDILPGSLSRELLTDLLRSDMGFNGLIVSDATQMAGFTVSMPRSQAVPASIAAGVDMFLFTVNQREDYEYMLRGVAENVITKERLDEAVSRILALKVSIGLMEKKAAGTLSVNPEAARGTIGNPLFASWAEECAEQSVTLVKNKENLIPLSPARTPRILYRVITLKQKQENDYDENSRLFKELMEKEGFAVTDFDAEKLPGGLINSKAVADIRKDFDLMIYFATCDVKSNQKDIRIGWSSFLGGDTPKFVRELPTVFISMSNPYHLADVPMVSTYINAYSPCPPAVRAVVRKLTGQTPFVGTSPVDPFCGLWDTRL